MGLIVDPSGNIIAKIILDDSDFNQKMKKAPETAKKASNKINQDAKKAEAERKKQLEYLDKMMEQDRDQHAKKIGKIAEKQAEDKARTMKKSSDEARRLLELDAKEAEKYYNQEAKSHEKAQKRIQIQNAKTSKSFYDRYIRIAVGFSVVYRAMRLIQNAIEKIGEEILSTVTEIDEFNVKASAMTASIVGLADIKNPLKGFRQALPEVVILMKKFELSAAHSIVSFEQLRESAFAAMKKGIVPVTDEDIKNITTLTELIKVIPVRADMMYKFPQEMAAMLAGESGKGRYVSQYLESIIPNLKEQVKLWREAGVTAEGNLVILEKISEAVKPFLESHKELSESWTTLKSSAETYWRLIKRIGGESVYTLFIQNIKELTDSLMSSKGHTEKLAYWSMLWNDILNLTYQTVSSIKTIFDSLPGLGFGFHQSLKAISTDLLIFKSILEYIQIQTSRIFETTKALFSKGFKRASLAWQEGGAELLAFYAKTDAEYASITKSLEDFTAEASDSIPYLEQLRDLIAENIKNNAPNEELKKLNKTVEDLEISIIATFKALKALESGELNFKDVNEYIENLTKLSEFKDQPELKKKYEERLKALKIGKTFLAEEVEQLKLENEIHKEIAKNLDNFSVKAKAYEKLRSGELSPERIKNYIKVQDELKKIDELKIKEDLKNTLKRNLIHSNALDQRIEVYLEYLKEYDDIQKKAQKEEAKRQEKRAREISKYHKHYDKKIIDDAAKAEKIQSKLNKKLANLDNNRLNTIKEEADEELNIEKKKINELIINEEGRNKLLEQAEEIHTQKMLEINGSAWDAMRAGYEKYFSELQTKYEFFSDFIKDSFQTVASTLSDILFDIQKNQLESFRDYLDNVLDMMLKKINDYMAGQLMQQFFNLGAGLGGLFSNSNIVPTGPTVDPGPIIQAHKGAFITSDMIPRYHKGGFAGLKMDEVPAILQTGETVLPRGSAPVNITYAPVIQAMDARSMKDVVSRNSGIFLEPFMKSIESGEGIIASRLRSLG